MWRLVDLINCFTWKKMSFAYKKWTKNWVMKLKDREKDWRLKAIRKNRIFKNKEKEAILCKAGAIYTAQDIFRSFKHATVAWMRVNFSKTIKTFLCFSAFCIFNLIFDSSQPCFTLSSSLIHVLKYELQCYYYYTFSYLCCIYLLVYNKITF